MTDTEVPWRYAADPIRAPPQVRRSFVLEVSLEKRVFGWLPPLALVAGLLIAGGSLSNAVHAQRGRTANPYDQEQRRLVREATRLGRGATGVVPLIELSSSSDRVAPGATRGLLTKLAGNRRLSAPRRVYAATLAALAQIEEASPDETVRALDELGYLRDWRVVGPFDNEGKVGFAREYPPEAQRNDVIPADAQYEGRERAVEWRAMPDITRYGYVDFDAVMRPYVNVCGYAETYVHSERARPMTLWAGAGGAIKVFFNGEEVVSDEVYRAADIERSVALVGARAGWNRVLVKVCVADRAWGFYLRVGEADGAQPRDIRVDANGATQAAAAPARPVRLGRAPVAPLAALEQAIVDRPESGSAHYDLALFLATTGADDPADNRARQLAERAAELDPTAEHLVFAAGQAETRADKMRFAAQAEGVAPNDEEVRFLRAAIVATGPDGGRALRLLDALPPRSVEHANAQAVRAAMFTERGLPLMGLSIIDAELARSGGSIYWLRQRIAALDELGRTSERLATSGQLLAAQYNAFDARRTAVAEALESGNADEARSQLATMLAIEPGGSETLQYAARVYEGLGEHDQALAFHRQLTEQAPEESSFHVAHGRALLRFGRRDAAAAALRRAIALRPQDAGTRRLLERIEPEERADEQYAASRETILGRREENGRWPARVLQDLTVTTVYPNGLSSSFHQVAFQVHTVEGARRWSSYSVTYEPGFEWVDLRSARIYRADGSVVEAVRSHEQRLGDPRYRIYYDTRAFVLDLPDLEPGDTVELRYRVEDVGRRNRFNDYFGDVHMLQRSVPTEHHEYVLITPRDRTFYFNEPGLRGLTHRQSEQAEQRIHHFVAEQVPPILGEARMPGRTEVSPYLHVSTYQSWEDVGRWWWGLAQDQLNPDEALERTVRELIGSETDTRRKVELIYAWVIRNTRYVGLEFGIHGFKPYRVTEVVHRGFGDCKDKASLLYAMLTLAGVDARIALIRTRRNGLIDEAPASLAIFDHAIAYVPEFDLYLDGTAETSGTNELPSADQGVMTLVVGPNSAELRRTPVLPAERERQLRELEVQLAADGSAEVTGQETIIGGNASSYRNRYEAPGTREERLQQALRGNFPGVELESQSFGDIEDLEAPVTFEYRARIPQLAQRAGGELRVPATTMSNLLQGLAPAPTRQHPMDFQSRFSFEERRHVRLPPGARATDVPQGGEARSPFGSLAVSWEARQGVVDVTTRFELTSDRVEASDYPAFRAWVERADALLRERLTVEGAQ